MMYSRNYSCGFPGGSSGKEPTYQCRRHTRLGFGPQTRKIPWKRAWEPTPVFLPGESHGQRSLAGYSPQGCKESDTTEQLSTAQHNPVLLKQIVGKDPLQERKQKYVCMYLLVYLALQLAIEVILEIFKISTQIY